MLGLAEADVAPDPRAPPLWVDTGSEQLVIPLATADAVRRAAPRADAAARARQQRPARDGLRVRADPSGDAGARAVVARFFFPKHGAVLEDPGTGSACANLGGWLLATGAPLPQRLVIARATRSAGRAGCRWR